MNKEIKNLLRESKILLDIVKRYSKKVDDLYNEVVLHRKSFRLDYPLMVYVDDNFRENYLKSMGTFIMKQERNPAEYCMGPGCNKFLGFRGFCSKDCHDKAYGLDAQRLVDELNDKGGKNAKAK